MTVELVGTKTGMLFGDYSYGKVLGPALQGVPLIIGINWFIMMYCCGTTIHALLQRSLTACPVPEPTQTRSESTVCSGGWRHAGRCVRLAYGTRSG